ncbi:hypothetical protein GN958_ATG19685 [Phytophthora infestans]|uniref:Uncharacterized protein n=1 Tax=Phytophthora infestans TaxID=4787 RepID=A0A8S9TRL1_PHYIN|nr:hypothetical protein GN958_ATG19685 [Phytophthora infestans]
MDPHNHEMTTDKVTNIFKKMFILLLKQSKRWKRVVSREYLQMDGSSCGIGVLAFIESYIFDTYEAAGDADDLRYRYSVKDLLTN